MMRPVGLFLAASLIGGVPAMADPPQGARWKPIAALTDEFSGPELDAAKWAPIQPYWMGAPPTRFDEKGASVAAGYLRLRSTTDLTNEVAPKPWIWIRSAVISSTEAIAGPGYYEARIKASRLSLSSSFWLQAGKPTPGRTNKGAEIGPEIDITESIGDPKQRPETAFMMRSNSHDFSRRNGPDKETPVYTKLSSPSTEWHTYGAWWRDARTIWYYLDGRKVGETVTEYDRFVGPMFMYFDTEPFKWSGLPTVAELRDESRNTMLVDWVRSWSVVGPAEGQSRLDSSVHRRSRPARNP